MKSALQHFIDVLGLRICLRWKGKRHSGDSIHWYTPPVMLSTCNHWVRDELRRKEQLCSSLHVITFAICSQHLQPLGSRITEKKGALMLKLTRHYIRYMLSALATVGFGMNWGSTLLLDKRLQGAESSLEAVWKVLICGNASRLFRLVLQL
jgi:hypothetical protein